jgi:hypothetical protein
MRLSKKRRERIVMAYVLATRGRLPTDLGELLAKMREHVPDLTGDDLRKAFAWVLRWSRRSAASFERKLRLSRAACVPAARCLSLVYSSQQPDDANEERC